jgi:adenylate kinase
MKDIYIVGGSHGVGKTTIMNEIAKQTEISIIHSGKFFKEIYDKEEAQTKLVYDAIAKAPVILDTHYAGHKKGIASSFNRGLEEKHLKILSLENKVECILIDVDTKTLLHRRWKDRNVRERNYDFDQTDKDLELNRKYFNEYCKYLKIDGYHIFNYFLPRTIKKVAEALNISYDFTNGNLFETKLSEKN